MDQLQNFKVSNTRKTQNPSIPRPKLKKIKRKYTSGEVVELRGGGIVGFRGERSRVLEEGVVGFRRVVDFRGARIAEGAKVVHRNRGLSQQSERRRRWCKKNLRVVLTSAMSKNTAQQPCTTPAALGAEGRAQKKNERARERALSAEQANEDASGTTASKRAGRDRAPSPERTSERAPGPERPFKFTGSLANVFLGLSMLMRAPIRPKNEVGSWH